jgi:hypothetical protein
MARWHTAKGSGGFLLTCRPWSTVDRGGLLVYGKNFQIKNSVVNSAIMMNCDTASITVQDSNINGGRTSWAAIVGVNLTVLRSEVTGSQHSAAPPQPRVAPDPRSRVDSRGSRVRDANTPRP